MLRFVILGCMTFLISCSSAPVKESKFSFQLSSPRHPSSNEERNAVLEGKYLSVDSISVVSQKYHGSCSADALKGHTYQNLIPYGRDVGAIISDDAPCARPPNFNAITVEPLGENKMNLHLGYGTGSVSGLFSTDIPEKEKFHLTDKAFITVDCSLTKYPIYKMGFGEMVCTSLDKKSWIKMIVR